MNYDLIGMILPGFLHGLQLAWTTILSSPQTFWPLIGMASLGILSALVPFRRRRRRYRY
jgi:hypothetical protein